MNRFEKNLNESTGYRVDGSSMYPDRSWTGLCVSVTSIVEMKKIFAARAKLFFHVYGEREGAAKKLDIVFEVEKQDMLKGIPVLPRLPVAFPCSSIPRSNYSVFLFYLSISDAIIISYCLPPPLSGIILFSILASLLMYDFKLRIKWWTGMEGIIRIKKSL